MKLIWENIALEQFLQVAEYVGCRFGEKRMDVFLQEVEHITDLLLINPYMGALDESLSDRTKAYRSMVVCKMDRIVYYVDDNDIIHISAFWDCRSNPINRIQHLS